MTHSQSMKIVAVPTATGPKVTLTVSPTDSLNAVFNSATVLFEESNSG